MKHGVQGGKGGEDDILTCSEQWLKHWGYVLHAKQLGGRVGKGRKHMCWRERDRHNQDPLSRGFLLLFVVHVYVYECFSCRVSC